MSRFNIWGDEIAYDHKVVARFVIKPTILRDNVESDLYSVDPEGVEAAHAAELAELEAKHNAEIENLETENARLLADLEAIDSGVEISELRAALAREEADCRLWRIRYLELQRAQETAKRAAKRQKRLTSAVD